MAGPGGQPNMQQLMKQAQKMQQQLVEAQSKLAETEVIRGYLPKQMTPAEIEAAVTAAVAETGAASVRDMGKVMGLLKTRYSGRMDFAAAGAAVKAAFR